MPVKPWPDPEEKPERFLSLEVAIVATLMTISLVLTIWSLVAPEQVRAHPGGLAADGCHNDRKRGGRHCHRGASPPPRAKRLSGNVYYPNCAAARAAGAAPVRRGDPCFAPHLDRDGDGIGCE